MCDKSTNQAKIEETEEEICQETIPNVLVTKKMKIVIIVNTIQIPFMQLNTKQYV